MKKPSGRRFNKGKPDFSLLPLHLLEPVARVWEMGAEKYDAWNWTNGMPWSTVYGCLMRHLAAHQKGETLDPESGQSHMAHVICNAMMLLYYEYAWPELDDRGPWMNNEEEPNDE